MNSIVLATAKAQGSHELGFGLLVLLVLLLLFGGHKK